MAAHISSLAGSTPMASIAGLNAKGPATFCVMRNPSCAAPTGPTPAIRVFALDVVLSSGEAAAGVEAEGPSAAVSSFPELAGRKLAVKLQLEFPDPKAKRLNGSSLS